MKKLLSVAVSSLAMAAMAVDVATVGVTEVTTTLKNTIVAVPFEKLGGGDINVHDIVKTTGLPEVTQLYVFNGGNYKGWLCQNGAWQAMTTASTIDGITVGTPAGTETMVAGSAIWLVLPEVPTSEQKFIVYGAYKTGVTSAIAPGTNLIANP